MSTRLKIWLTSALIYLSFFAWYTDMQGPLTDIEVEEFVAALTAAGNDPEEIAMIEQFGREDSGRQFLMVNNVDYNENPPRVEGAEPGEDAEQLMARYMEHMFPALLARASHPAVMGPAVFRTMDLAGIEGAEQWDMNALFRYRSRRTFLEIVTNPAFSGKHDFKAAALDKNIAFPIEPKLYLGDLRLILGLFLLALTALIDSTLMSRKLKSMQTAKA
jgi:hypothetical protein